MPSPNVVGAYTYIVLYYSKERKLLRTIRTRFNIACKIFILSFLACLSIVLWAQFTGTEVNAPADAFLLISVAALGFAFYEYSHLAFARLIMENMIISITAARTEQRSRCHNSTVILSDAVDIYVSCFGILLGSKVIKFNTEGIQLKKVDIGRDFISIHFGKGSRDQFIQLLNRSMNESEILEACEKFRRETGIIPNIVC